MLLLGTTAIAAETPPPKRTLGWFNATELSIVINEGNADTRSFGFKDTVRLVRERSRFRMKMDFVRTDTSDDRFLLVDPGFTFEPGETPTGVTVGLVEPPVEPDVEKALIEARYDRDITKRFYWNVGASWDRNLDAGIVNRYSGFAGLGNLWVDRTDLKWSTSYGVSYTDREEDNPDPDKEEQFTGFRLDSDLLMDLNSITKFENDFTGNMSFSDTADYAFSITNGVSVKASTHVSFKVSLQWLFNHEPALEDVDVVARVILIDPDGIPGSGDEFYETVPSGGTEITIGEDRVRKEQLDTIFRTTLVIDF